MMEHQTLHAIDYEATIHGLEKFSIQEIKEQMKIQPKAVVQSR
jgi:hypothetical protein